MLDDFQKPAQPQPKAAAPAEAQAAPEGDEDPLSDEFVMELTKSMESFMAQIKADGTAPPAPEGGAESASGPNEDELMRQFAQMLSGGLSGAGDAPSDSKTKDSAGSAAPGAGGDSFQDVIAATMDKLKQSKQSGGPSDPLGGLGLGDDNDLSQLLAALGGGENGEMPDLAKMLSTMMDDLMSKEILYEPIKDMYTRFPEYLASEKGAALSDDLRSRYEKQKEIMGKIIKAYEAPKYDDNDPESRKQVSELVTKSSQA
ncbi:Peroxisome chaperone and import receptor [Malassezia cuniculi]|uniref:Peroxisome chaperone and import receptor n=1 Tax=Malassezia cuniculi TaxID=948313 RepID=A0AAF0J713_9BASI|nr:Peroxisome chaperone and import receptor [Malassezia cuniculi]